MSAWYRMQYNSRQLLIAALLGVASCASAAGFDQCSEHFYQSAPPKHLKAQLNLDSSKLCFNGFATFYSGTTRTPLWSAEHLTRERLYAAEQIGREDNFHAESRLPDRMQAELSDYRGSGFDRGHLAPSADMATRDQQYDSFSLANIIPQAPNNNRYVWRNLETAVRYLTEQHGETYVLTGAAFVGSDVIQLNNRVIVPTHTFKAVYIPSIQAAGAYYAPNDDSKRVEVISLDELARRSGIDAFPALTAYERAEAADLPLTMSDAAEDPIESPDDTSLLSVILIAIISWLASLL